jgi:predicted nucleotidyltransferase
MHENLLRLKLVNQALANLGREYVFVGGATVSLYATNVELAAEIRPTDDVDVVVELAAYSEYSALDERLRAIGFKNDVESGIICRYIIYGIIVDVMPTENDAIGFSNKWYQEGFSNAIAYVLDEETSVQIFTLPYFMASKWEAFKGRGKNDYRTNKDFEDLVYVWENADDFADRLLVAPEHLKAYLHDELAEVIYGSDFEEGLYAHLTSVKKKYFS